MSRKSGFKIEMLGAQGRYTPRAAKLIAQDCQTALTCFNVTPDSCTCVRALDEHVCFSGGGCIALRHHRMGRFLEDDAARCGPGVS